MATSIDAQPHMRKRIVTYGKHVSKARVATVDLEQSPSPLTIDRDPSSTGILDRPDWFPLATKSDDDRRSESTSSSQQSASPAPDNLQTAKSEHHTKGGSFSRSKDVRSTEDQEAHKPSDNRTQPTVMVDRPTVKGRSDHTRDTSNGLNYGNRIGALASRPLNHGDKVMAYSARAKSSPTVKVPTKQHTIHARSKPSSGRSNMEQRMRHDLISDVFAAPLSDSDEGSKQSPARKQPRNVKSKSPVKADTRTAPVPPSVQNTIQPGKRGRTDGAKPTVEEVEVRRIANEQVIQSKAAMEAPSAHKKRTTLRAAAESAYPPNSRTKSPKSTFAGPHRAHTRDHEALINSDGGGMALEHKQSLSPMTPPHRSPRCSTPSTQQRHNEPTKMSPGQVLSPRAKDIWKKLLHTKTARRDSPKQRKSPVKADVGSPSALSRPAGVCKPLRAPDKMRPRRLVDALLRQQRNFDVDEASESSSSWRASIEPEDNTHVNEHGNADAMDIEYHDNDHQVPISDSQTSHQHLGTQRRVYGTQRTWLPEENLMDELTLGLTTQTASNQPVPVKETDEDGDEAINILTFHELRQAGANSRFDDEIGDCLERIGSPSSATPSARRSGLLDLAEKLRAKEYMQHFKGSGYEHKLFMHLGQETDIIAGFIMVSLLVCLMQESSMPHMVTHLRRHGLARLLIRLMAFDGDVVALAKERQSNMSRVGLSLLAEHHAHTLSVVTWGHLEPRMVPPRTLALKALDMLVRQTRDAGIAGELMSKELTTNLFDVLKRAKSDDVWQLPSGRTAIEFALAVSALEAHSLVARTVQDEAIWTREYLPSIATALEHALTRCTSGSDWVQLLLLRLTLNVTNGNAPASDVFARASLLRRVSYSVITGFEAIDRVKRDEELANTLDSLVLTLGVLINFAETSLLARRCVQGLHKSGDDPLEHILQLFMDNQARAAEASSLEDTQKNIPYGYLSVLLGYLCLEPAIAGRIKAKQAGHSLQPLIAFAEEFLIFHRAVDAQIQDGEDGGAGGPVGTLTARLESLVRDLRSL